MSQTTPVPRPGSDEINRAYEEGWVGNHTLAFIGDTLSVNGEKVPELFIVDIPRNEGGWKQPGYAPLEGTESTMPAPPSGVAQRRLTFTHNRAFPGLVNQPRHWVRSNPKASEIAFLMRDDSGVVQLWLLSPQGGVPDVLRIFSQRSTGIRRENGWDLCWKTELSAVMRRPEKLII